MSFQFYNLQTDRFTIKYGVKLVSFGISHFPLSVFDYLEHLWNRLESRISISVLNNQKTLTESS